MPAPVPLARFRRDVKRVGRRGSDMAKLRGVLTPLARGVVLPLEYRDHALRGNRNGLCDLHIEPDRLLLHRIVGNEVQRARTGTHSDLFR